MNPNFTNGTLTTSTQNPCSAIGQPCLQRTQFEARIDPVSYFMEQRCHQPGHGCFAAENIA